MEEENGGEIRPSEEPVETEQKDMKKSIRIAALCLAGLLLLALFACGKADEEKETQAPSETAEPAGQPEAPEESETEQPPKPEESPKTVSYANLEGSYFDGVSQRASADLRDEGDHVAISIHWASTLSDFSGWTMNATYEEGKLVYHDCVKTNSGLNENGELASEVEYENGEGYFVITDGAIRWTGAAEEACADCIFEKFGDD